MKTKTDAELFTTFMKIGAFTFGGGYAMISMIRDSCVEKKKWITEDEMMNITVIAESTPGPIAINAATYVGYRQDGLRGAIIATAGIVLPSFLIILLLASFLTGFLEIPLVEKAFGGIRIAVGVIILDAAFRMIRKMKKKPFPLTIMIAAFLVSTAAAILSLPVSSIEIMILAAVISLFHFLWMKKSRKGGAAE